MIALAHIALGVAVGAGLVVAVQVMLAVALLVEAWINDWRCARAAAKRARREERARWGIER